MSEMKKKPIKMATEHVPTKFHLYFISKIFI